METSLPIVQNQETKHVADPATALTRARYQRIAPFYDRVIAMMGQRVQAWRRMQWQLVKGARVLEVGVGTGKMSNSGPPTGRSLLLISRQGCWKSLASA